MKKNIYLFSISSHKDAIGINPLHIKFLHPDIQFDNYDYLIITSKQISKALLDYDTKLFKDKKALCISRASAKSYEEIGGKVLDIGKGYGDTLVESIKAYPKSTKWLYLRAKVVASDFVKKCNEDGYNIDEVILYESRCSENMKKLFIDEAATLIFTSPSSVNCFLEHNMIKDSHKIIVIGKTTAKALPNPKRCIIANDTTIDSCIELV